MYTRYAELRDSKGLKDADVSKATGIFPSTFTDWKNGTSKPKIEKLYKIAKFFEVPMETFIEGSD